MSNLSKRGHTAAILGHRVLGLALLLVGGANCSLVVNFAESDPAVPRDGAPGSDFDADPTLPDAGPITDAAAVAFCGPNLPNTIAYYSFENDDGKMTIANSVGGGVEATSHIFADDLISDIAFSEGAGPLGCGNAASIPEDSGQVMQINAAALGDVLSVDFWVRLDAVSGPLEAAGIISKDQVGKHNGDFGISLFRDTLNGSFHIVTRIQRKTLNGNVAEGVFFRCSPGITLDTWHHVAASADGSEHLLFVDGVEANANLPISPTFGGVAECNTDIGDVSADQTTTSENTNNWLIGGSMGRAPELPVINLFAGTVDELRFRSVAFTASEASLVYDSGRDNSP